MNPQDLGICDSCPSSACPDACPDPINAAANVATNCALGCLGQADSSGCTQDCTAEGTGMTLACSKCFADAMLCSLDNCLLACIANPSDAPCVECKQEHCQAAYLACTGFEQHCGNGADDNNNGPTDCQDLSCAYAPGCGPP